MQPPHSSKNNVRQTKTGALALILAKLAWALEAPIVMPTNIIPISLAVRLGLGK